MKQRIFAMMAAMVVTGSVACQTPVRVAELRELQPAPLEECDGELHLVALDEDGYGRLAPEDQRVSRAFLEELAELYHYRYGIDVEVHGPHTIERSSYSPKARQFVAEMVIDALEAATPSQEGSVVIGLLNADMRIAGKLEWRYAFSLRQVRGDTSFAAVSSYRMTHRNEERYRHRLHVMISKNVATHLCGFPLSSNPRSVTYNNVMEPADLDRMEFDLLTARPEK